MAEENKIKKEKKKPEEKTEVDQKKEEVKEKAKEAIKKIEETIEKKSIEKPKEKGLEREYIINIREKIRNVPIYKKTPKAIKSIKEFIVRHMKIRDRDLKKVRLDIYLNEYLWHRGIKNPPTRLKVKAIQEGELVRVGLAELPEKLKFKKEREERQGSTAKEISEKKKKEKPKEEEVKVEKSEEEIKEEKEKAAASAEAGKEMQKEAAKQAKHSTKISKQPKRQVRQTLQK